MNNFIRFIFIFILISSMYHTVRDILQILKVHTIISDIASTSHRYCRPYCDYVTFPPEIFATIGSAVVRKRRRTGLLGIYVIMIFIIWLSVWLSAVIFSL